MSDVLTITEIYASIQGESSFAGFPCIFVRTTGCPLRCRWCDTVYAFKGGRTLSFAEIEAEIDRLEVRLVELTGGEPLAQEGTPRLIERLLSRGYQVLIETSGAESVACLPAGTHIIMDLKCPDSGMHERNHWENLAHLKGSDEIKFVLASREDFDWAVEMIARHELTQRFQVLMSCAWGLVQPKDLASWMLEKSWRWRMQLQQHKYIWSPRAKGV